MDFLIDEKHFTINLTKLLYLEMKVWLSLTHGISHDAVVHTFKNTYKKNNI
jgi:hypothetical protein